MLAQTMSVERCVRCRTRVRSSVSLRVVPSSRRVTTHDVDDLSPRARRQWRRRTPLVPITTPMGRARMERWIGPRRDRARFVDATRARTIETTDRTTQKSPVTSSRRWTRRGRDDDGVIRSSDDVDAGTVGDGGVAAIAIDDAWSMVFACFGARERGGSAEEDSVEVRWRTGTEVGGGVVGARDARATRAGRFRAREAKSKESREEGWWRTMRASVTLEMKTSVMSRTRRRAKGRRREPDMGLDRAAITLTTTRRHDDAGHDPRCVLVETATDVGESGTIERSSEESGVG